MLLSVLVGLTVTSGGVGSGGTGWSSWAVGESQPKRAGIADGGFAAMSADGYRAAFGVIGGAVPEAVPVLRRADTPARKPGGSKGAERSSCQSAAFNVA